MRTTITITVILLALSACGGGFDSAELTPPDSTTDPIGENGSSTTLPGFANPPQRVPPTDSPVTGEVPEELLEAILTDAADRSGHPEDELVVIRSQFVEWSDGSLGCPQPGEVYIQVIIAGYWVVVEAPEQTYDYRVDDQGHFKLCESQPRGDD